MNTAIVGGSSLSFTYLCGPFISACVKVEVACKLSGMPDLTLSFVNPRILDDVSFHPCIRFRRWEVRKFMFLL